MSKYTTIAQIKADIKLSYAKILDLWLWGQCMFHPVINITEDASDPRNGKKISRRKMEGLW